MISGEDGTVEFDGASEDATVLYDGLALSLTSGPLARVDIKAEYTWTQQAQGAVDLTKYLISNWPEAGPNYITSLTLNIDSWPKTGAGIGNGWTVTEATALTPYTFQTFSETHGASQTVTFPDTSWFGPSSHSESWSETHTFVDSPAAWAFGISNVDQVTWKASPEEPSDISHVPGIGDFSATIFRRSATTTDR
jgi:hypothetical protein